MFHALQCLILDTLVLLLGSENFEQRQIAETLLRAHGWEARQALERGQQSADPEVRKCCTLLREEALNGLLSGFGEPLPEIDSAWFLLDVEASNGRGYYWPSGWAQRYDRMVPYLDAVGRDCSPWHNYRTATRNWLRAEIEAGTDLDDLHALMNEMRVRDKAFLGWPGAMPYADDIP